MANQVIFRGRGDDSMYDEYMSLINRSFEFNCEDGGFLSLLPKLYKPEYNPCASNYVIREEDGNLKAAVGAYDDIYHVCDITLKCRGIGNVAVIHEARSRGYMRDLMNDAVEDMIADGVDFTALGGRRIRYQYFSYEPAGAEYHFRFASHDIAHRFGKRPVKLTFREITDPSDSALSAICALHDDQNMYCEREGNIRFFDVAKTWHRTLTAIYNGVRFIGYAIHSGDTVTELILSGEKYIEDFVCDFMHHHQLNSMMVMVPCCKTKMASRMTDFCDSMSLHNNASYSVFNYKRVIEAFLTLKSCSSWLEDGKAVLLIHGKARDEYLRILVRDGSVKVEDVDASCAYDEPPEFELTHTEAMNFLFGAVSPLREIAATPLRTWLPIPLYMYNADEV
ncbi:MAG: GNAT family N-acetyltransferase [Clostridia bacterium]|nr:GNAT family N-acetyltransferase [Clostridia bacterium]